MFGKIATNEKGAIPIIILIILSGVALFGLGTLVGIMLTKGIQGFALIIAGTILLVVALVNITGVIRWVKELKREIKGKEIKNEEQ
jgi:membrane protein implicated in regulation of membrane protease activity